MYRYLLFMMGLMPLTTLAQQKLTLKPIAPKPAIPADTVYFDQDWAHTDVPEDRKYARLIRHGTDGLPTGTVRDFYYPSWKKQWEGKLVSEDPEQANGLCIFWYETGKMKARGTYARGQALSDYQEWRPDGLPVKCSTKLVDALPTEQAQLHSQTHIGGSQHVFYAVLPPGTTNILYRFDIRDEGQPPISWNSAVALVKSSVPGASALDLAMSALQSQAGNQSAPLKSTQCHYFLTTDRSQAEAFLSTKGGMPESTACLYTNSSTQREVRPLAIPTGARQVYFCVNNDNFQTAAIAKLSVTAVVKECK
jgi:hypothetical protein